MALLLIARGLDKKGSKYYSKELNYCINTLELIYTGDGGISPKVGHNGHI